ncbi:type IV pilus twitching motility protein PilT [Pseudobacteriovorax antillogorgiicola]|uniref:Twitching motility protein PilT n=1 Tax=Pseudobacteriovorax antillogorgiicola TaxID=1513793 RepID=A0A1Y6C0K8_9BACT|nr:PilT/PilU family type 4a pilus ATPase [Pseudobacteriovorax antillogorgiicola]TCS52315.1 twitching motility protein PilT [Pseudobacteriovorax antillogorgiicola]SMF30165.1 twitching motility protein PilT [Pseudobacteriovorax antillogorgiicola]
MKLEKILKVAVRGGASDVILKTGSIPRFRFNGELLTLTDGETIDAALMQDWISALVPQHLKVKLHELVDLDFSYTTSEGNRFRVNLFRQMQKYGLVLRVINSHIRTMEELQLPSIMKEFPKLQRGLILVTGATGSGKSTTLASIIEKINTTRAAHIITIEDPIEFVFKEKKATINQREIGTDTLDFESALRSALRQNPDVILVGELRDRETTETALMAAETGHLVLSTLHTMDAVESLTRLLSYFPPHQHDSLRIMLSQTLNYIVSQRLIPKADQRGLVPAMEILASNELVREEIQKGEDFRILKDAIRNGKRSYGMQSFDQSLLFFVKKGIITEQTAIQHATNKKDLELALRGFGQG